jgi:hypothetical protein
MLASITPLGERGRESTWSVTISAFAFGATIAGAACGALIGAAGGLVLSDGAGSRPRLLALGALAAVAMLIDLRPGSAPGPRRQVNERWLDEFRGWIYGFGFGAQLGLALTTVVASAATYVAWGAAFLIGEPVRSGLVLGVFGAVRGLTPLAAARVRRPDQLLALHARLERWRAPASRAGAALLAATLALAVLGSAS